MTFIHGKRFFQTQRAYPKHALYPPSIFNVPQAAAGVEGDAEVFIVFSTGSVFVPYIQFHVTQHYITEREAKHNIGVGTRGPTILHTPSNPAMARHAVA